MNDIVKICKKHGPLTEKEAMKIKAKKKYIYFICRECHLESGRKYRANNKEKEDARRRRRLEKLKASPKTEKTCKKHGVLSRENISPDFRCVLCRRETDNANKKKNRENIRLRRHEKYDRLMRGENITVKCIRHGLLSKDLVNRSMRCKLCCKNKHKKYYESNKQKVWDRIKKYRENNKEWFEGWKKIYSERRKNETVERRNKKRAHWLPDTIKECRHHGLLNLSQVINYKHYFYCKKCKEDWMARSEINRKPKRFLYHRLPHVKERNRIYANKQRMLHPEKARESLRRSSRKRVANLAEGYVKSIMCRKYGFKRDEIPVPLVQVEKEVLKLKRTIRKIRKIR